MPKTVSMKTAFLKDRHADTHLCFQLMKRKGDFCEVKVNKCYTEKSSQKCHFQQKIKVIKFFRRNSIVVLVEILAQIIKNTSKQKYRCIFSYNHSKQICLKRSFSNLIIKIMKLLFQSI